MTVFSESTPVRFADTLPPSVDVIVIGAGIVGISTAWYLVERGQSVLVCEKGRVAGEQSSRNWGWIRQQGRDAAELPIMMESINRWETIAAELDVNIGFERRGVLYTAETSETLEAQERWLDVAAQHQLDTRMLSGAEIDDLVDDKPGQWRGGMFTPSDGRAEPFKAVPAMARALQSRGALIREACAVRSLDLEAGRVAGVVTESGRVRASSVVCASGAWSSLFLGNHGISLPQLTVRATVTRTSKAPHVFTGSGTFGEVAVRRRQDGGYTVASSATNEHFVGPDSFRHLGRYLTAASSNARMIRIRLDEGLVERFTRERHWSDDAITPFERQRVLNPKPSLKALAAIRDGLARRLPRLARLSFAESWAGMIDMLPDVVPVMDSVRRFPGLFLATGFSGHGFGIGPGAGKVMADLVTGAPHGHDLSRFRSGRFSDGSRMRPGPGL